MKKANAARHMRETPLGCYEVDEELEAKMKKMAKMKLTKEEIRAQTISWVYGNLPVDSELTIEDVTKFLEEHEGL